jgi:hypothetical protein
MPVSITPIPSTVDGNRIPNNINPLSPNGFMLNIQRLPRIKYFCQQVNIPAISLGDANMANPLVNFPVPGDQLVFSELQVQFLVDEYMCNYKSIVDWINGLGFPEDHEQYTQMLDDHQQSFASELTKNFSDATLEVLDSNNLCCKRINFKDMFPTSIEGLQFESTSTDVVYLVANATFRYTNWVFEDDNCCP